MPSRLRTEGAFLPFIILEKQIISNFQKQLSERFFLKKLTYLRQIQLSDFYLFTFSFYHLYFNSKIQQMRKTQYTYVTHPQNLPLEIDGRSKKRIQPLKRQQFNGEKATINQEGRSLLLKKLSNNTHDLDHLKSVIPTDDSRKKSRPNSIKTFNDDKENIKSGIDYLMQKTENLKGANHKEKAHIGEFMPVAVKRPERKHFMSVNVQTVEPETKKPQNHKKTSEMRLVNDLYSNVYREEKESCPSKRVEAANLFRCGEDLGLEKKREKKMSQNKLIEMFGSECMRAEKGPLRERRQDWRTSNINFF